MATAAWDEPNNKKSSLLFSEGKFKKHLEAIQKDRFKNSEEEMAEAVNKCVKPHNNKILVEANTELTCTPTNAEIKFTLKEMRDGALGNDDMRLK